MGKCTIPVAEGVVIGTQWGEDGGFIKVKIPRTMNTDPLYGRKIVITVKED